MARAQIYDPEPFPRRTTWPGFRTPSTTVNGGNPPSPAEAASMDIYDNPDANTPTRAKLTSGAGQITINDAATWDMTVLPVKFDLAPGRWHYRLMVTRADGQVKNYLKGTLTIE